MSINIHLLITNYLLHKGMTTSILNFTNKHEQEHMFIVCVYRNDKFLLHIGLYVNIVFCILMEHSVLCNMFICND